MSTPEQRAIWREKGKLARLSRKARGLCVRCLAPVKKGRSLCGICAVQGAEAKRDRQIKRLTDGLCVICGKQDRQPGKGQCVDCSQARVQYDKERRQQRKADGICCECSRQIKHPGGTLCQVHLARKRTQYQKTVVAKRRVTKETKVQEAKQDYTEALYGRDKQERKQDRWWQDRFNQFVESL